MEISNKSTDAIGSAVDGEAYDELRLLVVALGGLDVVAGIRGHGLNRSETTLIYATLIF